jgi:hypothetical protein
MYIILDLLLDGTESSHIDLEKCIVYEMSVTTYTMQHMTLHLVGDIQCKLWARNVAPSRIVARPMFHSCEYCKLGFKFELCSIETLQDVS